ncbi:hypothetical protein [Aeromonas simiae]|uniref:hypothetical protein n=1 Tax=Aeromonas simiae TaxID=218936 RepID=UPI0012EEC928|nr:hypothetical protein [Aeromonas simiae]
MKKIAAILAIGHRNARGSAQAAEKSGARRLVELAQPHHDPSIRPVSRAAQSLRLAFHPER